MLKFKFLVLFTISSIILSGREANGYESVHNKSLGKMEMLEAIDRHIKGSISKDIAFLKEEVRRLKSKKTISSPTTNTSYKNKRLSYSVEENRSQISKLKSDVDRLIIKINSLEESINRMTKQLTETRAFLKSSSDR